MTVEELKGQTAFVTGASRGIGRATAVALARAGADVAITGRDAQELAATRDEVQALGRRCVLQALDLADLAAGPAFYDEAEKHFGRVDILVNNAGVGSSADPKPVVNFDDDFWEYTLRVNLTAPYRLCKRAVQHMLPRKYGRIINIASIAGRTGTLHGAAYSASKHGLLGLTRSLSMEVATQGITVNAVCPGGVTSLMSDKRIAYDAARLGRTLEDVERNASALGRRISPEEIAHFVVSLAVPGARAATGQAFVIDAGTMNS